MDHSGSILELIRRYKAEGRLRAGTGTSAILNPAHGLAEDQRIVRQLLQDSKSPLQKRIRGVERRLKRKPNPAHPVRDALEYAHARRLAYLYHLMFAVEFAGLDVDANPSLRGKSSKILTKEIDDLSAWLSPWDQRKSDRFLSDWLEYCSQHRVSFKRLEKLKQSQQAKRGGRPIKRRQVAISAFEEKILNPETTWRKLVFDSKYPDLRREVRFLKAILRKYTSLQLN